MVENIKFIYELVYSRKNCKHSDFGTEISPLKAGYCHVMHRG